MDITKVQENRGGKQIPQLILSRTTNPVPLSSFVERLPGDQEQEELGIPTNAPRVNLYVMS